MIDTHAHIYLEEFENDCEQMISSAKAIGVTKILLPNIDLQSIEKVIQLVKKHPDICKPMMGLHPCYVKENVNEQLLVIEEALHQHSFIAIGEIGTDLYWDKTFWTQQQQAFIKQLSWAYELKLPVSIHSRESTREAIDSIRNLKGKHPRGVFHCFSGTLEEAKEVIGLGFALGIGGVITFRKSGLDALLSQIDMQHIVLETDSPYLAPVPYRGKRNEPAYLQHIRKKLADVKQISEEEIDRITTNNAIKIFNL
ncbi:MAG: TatD family hydrolase [Cyclobacteriaceae bacterium]|jgi:TatD DNase family protein|nr:TatD family hydrolase [Cyclobacteriaceae bacterium]